MHLIVDTRENAIIKLLQNNTSTDEQTMTYTVAPLEVGDFAIYDSSAKETLHCIIERKTVNDLCASIKDGRFREQKARLGNIDAGKVIYIIEEYHTKHNGKLPKSTIDGAIVNLLFKHGFKVLFSLNSKHTLEYITMMHKKFANGDFSSNVKGDVAPTKLLSKGDVVAENITALQLSAIRGVSYKVATFITESYPSMKSLIDAYSSKDTEDEKKLLLAHLQITKTRKLGKALSAKIYETLHSPFI
jgi:crossover junction endonuclease MUS81